MNLQIVAHDTTRTMLDVSGKSVAVLCRITTVCPAELPYQTVADFVTANRREDDGDWVVDVPGIGEVSWHDRDDLVIEVLQALNEAGVSIKNGPPAYDLER
jgi:hypothetical protein